MVEGPARVLTAGNGMDITWLGGKSKHASLEAGTGQVLWLKRPLGASLLPGKSKSFNQHTSEQNAQRTTYLHSTKSL